MEFAVVDLGTIREVYPHWEHLRKSNDGTKVIIHKEIFDRINPMRDVMTLQMNTLSLDGEPQYPYPLVTGEEINAMEEFQSKEDNII